MSERHWPWWAFVLAGVLLLSLIVCGAGGIALYRGSGTVDVFPASRELSNAVADYRATGLPWEAKELDPSPPVKPEDNAAPLLERAFEGLDSMKVEDAAADIGKAAKAGKWQDVDEGLTAYARLMDAGIGVASRPRIDFHYDYDLGPFLRLEELLQLKSLAYLFADRASLKASRGDTDGCLADLRTGFRLASLVGQGPLLAGGLKERTCDDILFRSIQTSASVLSRDKIALGDLDQLSASHGQPIDPTRYLAAEAYMGITVARNWKMFERELDPAVQGGDQSDQGDRPIDASALLRTGLPSSILPRAFLTRHLQYWTSVWRHKTAHPGDLKSLSQFMHELSDRDMSATALSYRMFQLTHVDWDPYLHVERYDASYRITRALLGALRYRLDHGRLPTKIEEIPGKWIDPFTGKPLKLAYVGKSLRIYSLGPGGRDDGGRTGDEGSDAGNIIAAYPVGAKS